ncbi:MAG: BREX system P-loop protein BrxC [Negativicutes bacterium]|nr:BREX system P-loop protein BrxC [Negativicutes bacterium]
MLNKDIFLKDPVSRKLANQGVASVNESDESILRYELETFVCSGQYEKGLVHILRTYLENLKHPQQPGVWISGFFGSGKSHLVKILAALWLDYVFSDGATARGITALPLEVQELFRELKTAGQRHGGLHSVSGTLKANDDSNSARAAILAMIFKSVGLPAKYHFASFVMWLQEEGILDQIRQHIENAGKIWDQEVLRLHVSTVLRDALVQIRPQIFFDEKTCADILRNQFPSSKDVSSDDMIKAIKQALSKDGKLPLTLIVLDEVQQYIGEDSQRSIDVQEVVEACSKNIGGKLLFVGTGQTAVTGTSNLKKLEGRFTVRVELSDADVDAVIRQVILAKKPEAMAPISSKLQDNLGEISRHLTGTTIAHRQADLEYIVHDYPILPVRRRLWENALRVLDQSGTDSQLRNQLSLIHKVIQTNAEQPIGHVAPADFIFFDLAENLLRTRILPRKVYEKTMGWKSGTTDEQLMSRACALVFLITKLAAANTEIGLKTTVDTLADLLVEDLSQGSSLLRSKLPGLLSSCELLMKVGDEYRIQTEESAAWNDEFLSQRTSLASTAHRIETERDDRIRRKVSESLRKISIQHGTSKTPRDISTIFDPQLPSDASEKIYVWIRDGWSTDENSVLADARHAGNQSPTIFVFIPKRSADDLRHQLMDFKAASATLDKRGVPSTPEGTEARAAMETAKFNAEARITALLDDAFSGARVFQGGGSEILGNELQDKVTEAAKNSLARLFPQFDLADNNGWTKVLERAQKGAPDALKAVGYEGEPGANVVCKAILGFIAGGKKGVDIRNHFEGPVYGWPRDAVDGALLVMVNAGLVRALDDMGKALDAKTLDRKNFGKTSFKVEATTISAAQKIQIRKVLQKIGIAAKPGEESASIPEFVQRMKNLAERAGGEAPKPAIPDTACLEDIRLTTGNEQLLAVYNLRDELAALIDSWTEITNQISKHWPAWSTLVRLKKQAATLSQAKLLLDQISTIEQERQLLNDPDLVSPLVSSLAQILRAELNRLDREYSIRHEEGMARLKQDDNWQQLEPEQRHQLLSGQMLHESARPKVEVQATEDVLRTLEAFSLTMFEDRIAAIPGRFDAVLQAAAELMEPAVQFIQISKCTLNTESEINDWIEGVRCQLKTALMNGPVRIQ